MRVLFFSEALAPPADEGIKVVARSLLAEVSRLHTVLALTNRGLGIPDLSVRRVAANRILASLALRGRVRAFRPDLVVYLPTACGTPLSFLRMHLLHQYAMRAPTAMVVLQLRVYGRIARAVIPRFAAGPVWAQAERTAAPLRELGLRVLRFPPAVDCARFRPASLAERAELRSQYGIPTAAFVLLHVGHLNSNRNLPILAGLQAQGDAQIMLVGSTSTTHEVSTLAALRAAGVTLLTSYIPAIEDVYRMADAYLFPVKSPTGCIDVPLSVLEAMASDLPVVSTRYGDLPRLFSGAPGLLFYDGAESLRRAVARVRQGGLSGNRRLVEPLTWAEAARALVEGSARDGGAYSW